MTMGTGLFCAGGLFRCAFAVLPLCLLIAAGCSKPSEPAAPSADGAASGSGNGGGMQGGGRQGGGRRGGGGRGGPVAANATGAEIYQAKCGCHGPEGKGGRAPALAAYAAQTNDALYSTIHNGKGKMPAFAGQLTDAQIKLVVADVKQFR